MNDRTAPTGKLWANIEDSPLLVGLVMSQECALDKLDPLWETYPSWPNYPDERNLPVSLKAREDWAKRRPLRLAELARRAKKNPDIKIPDTENPDICPGCGKPLPISTTKPRKFHNDACRKKAARK